MKRLKIAFLVFICFIGATACDVGATKMEFYVLTPEAKATRFTQDVASIVATLGLKPNLGQATDDKGYTVFVVEAKGSWVRLRSQNMLLSGKEDPTKCGRYDEPHSDPGQFFVVVEPIIPSIGKRRAAGIATELKNELSKLGYDVRDTPVVCSPLSKIAAK